MNFHSKNLTVTAIHGLSIKIGAAIVLRTSSLASQITEHSSPQRTYLASDYAHSEKAGPVSTKGTTDSIINGR
jgi:hypothetical protein